MLTLLLVLLFSLCLGLIVKLGLKPSLAFEYPYFMAVTFAVFILPQAYSLARFPGGVSETAVENVMLMTVLCVAACVAGYQMPPLKWGMRTFARPTEPGRLLAFGVFLCLCGALALIMLPRGNEEFGSRGGMTGIQTIYLFFIGLAFPGFAICVLMLRQKFTPWRLGVVLVGSVIPVLATLNGRRENAVMLALTLALTRFYTTGKAVPRWLIITSVGFAMLAIPATGAYRSLVAQGRAADVTKFDFVQNFKDFVGQESILELRNAAALMRSTEVVGKYGLGTGYWNQMVHRFVPAQIVGRNVKEGMLIGSSIEKMYATKLALAYEIPQGSTVTGMGDSYEQFGWFGCLFFFLLARIFRTVWTASLQPNGVFAQLFYIMICSSAMRTVTHQTVDFLPGMVYQLIFLRMGLWYAAIPARDLPPATAAVQARPQQVPARSRGRR